MKPLLIEKIESSKSLNALNAACKDFAEFRKPNSFEFAVNEYGKAVKYVLDCGEYQSSTKFNSLADVKNWAVKQAYTNGLA